MSSLSQRERHRKAQALPLSGIARGSGGDSGSLQKVGAKGEKRRRKSGSGKEVSSRTLSVKAQWNGGHFIVKKWESEKAQKKLRHDSRRFQGAMWPLTAACWERLASGERVVGQWYSWIKMKRLGSLHGMYGSMEAELEVQRTVKRAELTAFFYDFSRE